MAHEFIYTCTSSARFYPPDREVLEDIIAVVLSRAPRSA